MGGGAKQFNRVASPARIIICPLLLYFYFAGTMRRTRFFFLLVVSFFLLIQGKSTEHMHTETDIISDNNENLESEDIEIIQEKNALAETRLVPSGYSKSRHVQGRTAAERGIAKQYNNRRCIEGIRNVCDNDSRNNARRDNPLSTRNRRNISPSESRLPVRPTRTNERRQNADHRRFQRVSTNKSLNRGVEDKIIYRELIEEKTGTISRTQRSVSRNARVRDTAIKERRTDDIRRSSRVNYSVQTMSKTRAVCEVLTNVEDKYNSDQATDKTIRLIDPKSIRYVSIKLDTFRRNKSVRSFSRRDNYQKYYTRRGEEESVDRQTPNRIRDRRRTLSADVTETRDIDRRHGGRNKVDTTSVGIRSSHTEYENRRKFDRSTFDVTRNSPNPTTELKQQRIIRRSLVTQPDRKQTEILIQKSAGRMDIKRNIQSRNVRRSRDGDRIDNQRKVRTNAYENSLSNTMNAFSRRSRHDYDRSSSSDTRRLSARSDKRRYSETSRTPTSKEMAATENRIAVIYIAERREQFRHERSQRRDTRYEIQTRVDRTRLLRERQTDTIIEQQTQKVQTTTKRREVCVVS